MTKTGALAILAFVAVALLLLLTIDAEMLSDKNSFLKDFVGIEMLGFLGIILTISIGFLAQLFVGVGKLREKLGEDDLALIRNEIRSTSSTLVISFMIALLIAFLNRFSTQLD